jgi:hypothetical protein
VQVDAKVTTQHKLDAERERLRSLDVVTLQRLVDETDASSNARCCFRRTNTGRREAGLATTAARVRWRRAVARSDRARARLVPRRP